MRQLIRGLLAGFILIVSFEIYQSRHRILSNLPGTGTGTGTVEHTYWNSTTNYGIIQGDGQVEPSKATTNNQSAMAVANHKEDTCFLCNLLPFRKNANKDAIIVEDPRETASHKTNSVVSAITEFEDYEKTNMDFANADYRGFVFAIHPEYGYLLLHCTRKKNKPNHFQVPGGHIDNHEFKTAAQQTSEPLQQLLLAGKLGAARELFEETSIDLRNSLERLEPTKLYKKERKDKLTNEYKNRLFYTIHLRDDDFPTGERLSVSGAAFLQKAMGVNPPNLTLKLSMEHQGFAFEKFPDVAATLLQHHSGGKVSTALRMSATEQEKKK